MTVSVILVWSNIQYLIEMKIVKTRFQKWFLQINGFYAFIKAYYINLLKDRNAFIDFRIHEN